MTTVCGSYSSERRSKTMVDIPKPDVERSGFNMGIASLERQNDALVGCNRASLDRDPSNWVRCLLILNREIRPYMTGPERKKVDELKTAIYPQLNSYERAQRTGAKANTQELYDKLDELDVELRCIMKRHGIYGKDAADAGTAITR